MNSVILNTDNTLTKTMNGFLFFAIMSYLWWIINLFIYPEAKASDSKKVLVAWWFTNLGLFTSGTIAIYGVSQYGLW
jgi:hypothetical protein